ncbi:MAG: anaerobic ribonucleoside-triphosphate reductase activating protein [Clostridia bacterium]|nr:anaerobic ribonucleoside-triphosphate reductase activating protein [Clostridia bacterium]
MNYALIRENDIANGPGVRTSLFVSGCRHHCKGCFNPETWNFNYGNPFTQTEIDKIIEASQPSFIEGLTLLGGEPFEPENQDALIELLKQFKTKLPHKKVWCYSGFSFEHDLLLKAQNNKESVKEMLQLIDVLVDGKFVEELKSPALLFRGSSNQNIIDVKASLSQGKMILLEGVWERKMGSGNIYE